MFYVCIDHLSDQDLAVLGYTVIGEDKTFKIYRNYNGDTHMVEKAGKKFIYVDDVNDAIAMNSEAIVQMPK